MGFLDKLRMANIFPRNPGQERPFGMPDMNQGDDFIRKILPIADNLERSRNTRYNAGAQAERDLYGGPKNPQPNRLKNIFGQLGINKPENVVYGGVQPNSPMQDRMNEQSDAQQAINLEDKNFDRGVMREGNVASAAKRAGDLEFQRAAMTKAGEDETARELAEISHQRELTKETTAFDRRRQLANEAARSAIDKERITGEEDRKTWETRGDIVKNQTPSQQTHDFRNRVQQLSIQYPEYAAFIEEDPSSGGFKFKSNVDPKVREWITNFLMNNPGNANAPAPGPKTEIDLEDLNRRADDIINRSNSMGGR